MLYIML